MAQKLICPACGYAGSPKTAVKGSILIEIVLWLCFLIPGIIYSLWRSSSRHKACPACGSTNMVPIDSPVGKNLLSDQGKTVEQVLLEKPPKKIYSKTEKILIGVVVVVGLFFIIGVFSAMNG